jgi:nicotinamide mononucleotide transporter
MTISQIVSQFLSDIKGTRYQEWISTIAQLASVWYAKQNNVLVYPTGIIGVLFAAYVYYFIASPPLYADSLLNLYYLLMSIYGWYNWTQKKDSIEVYPIAWCSVKERTIGILFFLLSWILIFLLLEKFTDSDTPVLDSLVSSSAVTAMWWMAKRKIDNWIAWIFSNIIAIPLNFYKGFMLFTLMYVFFLVLAWIGYKQWQRENNTKA